MLWWSLRQAKSAKPETRMAAIAGLRGAAGPEAIDHLLVLSSDREESVATAAVEALLSMGADAERVLTNRITSGKDYNLAERVAKIAAESNYLTEASSLAPATIAAVCEIVLTRIRRDFETWGTEIARSHLDGHMRHHAHALEAVSNIAALQPLLADLVDESHLSLNAAEGSSAVDAKLLFCGALERVISANADRISADDLQRITKLRLKRPTYVREHREEYDLVHTTGIEEEPLPPVVARAEALLRKRTVPL